MSVPEHVFERIHLLTKRCLCVVLLLLCALMSALIGASTLYVQRRTVRAPPSPPVYASWSAIPANVTLPGYASRTR